MLTIRPLSAADVPALENFLAGHRDTSMFLRANLRRAGLPYSGAPGSAHYVGAFGNQGLLGVVAHSWNGMVLVQAPEHAASLARAVIELSGRAVTGFSGPEQPVRAARTALRLDDADTEMDEDEGLYGLDLSSLEVPGALSNGEIVCRAPRPEERELLCAWRLAYNIEALGASDSPQLRASTAQFMDAQIADGNAWVAIANGKPVSLSAFNAALPDIVQLGGIYTPPELRGRGYARAAVAASLLAARDRGAARAVLFTSNPAAAKAYEAVGFRRIGTYALILLRQGS